MDSKEFIKNLASQFDDIESADLQMSTQFKKLEEWSSLVALSVIAMVDEEYNVAIKGDDIRNSETIEDLYEIVKGKL